MTLTRRLLLLALISVLPAIAIWTYTEVSLRRARQAEVNDTALRQAQIVSLDLGRIFEGVHNLLLAIEEVPAIVQFNEAECSAYLRSLQAQVPHLDALAVLDRNGRVRCAQGVSIGADFKDQNFFKDAYVKGRFVIGEYSRGFADSVSNPPAVLPLALGLRSGDEGILGVMVAALDLNWLGQQLNLRALPPDSSIAVADRKGVILARQPLMSDFVGTRISEQTFRYSNESRPGAFEAIGPDGIKRIYGYMPITVAPEDVFVTVGLSSKMAFNVINQASRRGFILIGIAMILALSLSGLIGHFSVTKPFEKMIAAVQSWRAGDYGARVTTRSSWGELGILAKAFNDLMNDVAERQRTLQATEERARLALEAGNMGTWWFDHRNKTSGWSTQASLLLGLPADKTTATLQEWRRLLHPGDADRVLVKMRAAVKSDGHYHEEYRIRRANGEFRWFDSRGRTFFDFDQTPVYSIGVFQDITERKHAEEQRSLLLDELNHRVKNTLATVQSIASQTIRSSTDRSHFKDSFESRLLALSKTHDLLTRNAWRDADLKAIADQELAPYRRDHDTRVTMRGPPVRLPARVAINFGLVLHELVTNAVKYGALSTVDGRVTLAWTIDSYTPGRPRLIVHWSETGGPAVPPPKHQGFGSRLIQRSVKSELGGQLNVAFLPSGVVYDLFVPLEEARHHRSFR